MTARRDRRAGLAPSAHQGVEILLGLLLGYAAIHETESHAAVLLVNAAGVAALALLAPGSLSPRPVLGHRVHRIIDVVLAIAGVATAVSITRSDLVATVPLLLAALILIRLGLSRSPTTGPRSGAARVASDRRDAATARRAGVLVGSAQPTLNRVARAAGLYVRNRRSTTGR